MNPDDAHAKTPRRKAESGQGRIMWKSGKLERKRLFNLELWNSGTEKGFLNGEAEISL
jgi:hypothetical protein